jgi:hypothetical protein
MKLLFVEIIFVVFFVIHSSMALQVFVGPWPLAFQLCNLFTAGRTPSI